MSLSLMRFTVGALQENCYLVFSEETKQAVLIDPGDEAERLLGALEQQNLSLEAIWLTHAHFDHIGAVQGIRNTFDVPVLLHPNDKELYHNSYKAAAIWNIPFEQPTAETTDLTDEQILNLAGVDVKCLFTPGHAPGHIAFYIESQSLVLAGDALFQGSIGRTDLPSGNHTELIESIKTKLLVLPDDTQVYPGHGPETTIGIEKIYNPFLS